MSAQQESPAKPQSPAISFEDISSQSSHSYPDIDSRPTSPSHSTNGGAEKVPRPTLEESSSCSSPRSSLGEETEDETELFQDTPPIIASAAEIEEFSYLASELSLFASCIASAQSPTPLPSPAVSPSPEALTIQIIPSSSPVTDDEQTPTQASIASAEVQRTEAQSLVEQRREDLKKDLMVLISDEEGPNRELIMSIDCLLRDWRSVHKRLEKWRREMKGEKVREMYKMAME